MLRPRPHATARGVLSHPATGWLVLSFLYLVAAALNLMLALRAEASWPIVLASALAVGALGCLLAAWQRLR